MSKILKQTNEIIRMLEKELKGVKTLLYINPCYDPIFYLQSYNYTKFPLVLVSYRGSLYNISKLYPGPSEFHIYFVDIKKKADELLDIMQAIHGLFNTNVVQTKENDKIVTGQKLLYQDQGFYAENNEHIIYVQKYNLLIP